MLFELPLAIDEWIQGSKAAALAEVRWLKFPPGFRQIWAKAKRMIDFFCRMFG